MNKIMYPPYGSRQSLPYFDRDFEGFVRGPGGGSVLEALALSRLSNYHDQCNLEC